MKYDIIFAPEAEEDLDRLRAYGILIGFADPEEWWEELLLRHPRFQARIVQARKSLDEGKGRSIKQLREKYAIESQ